MGSAMQVTISFATTDQQIEHVQHLEEGATVREAIEHSGIMAQCPPGYQLEAGWVGIFGRQVPLDSFVSDGDRIELYRPLEVDPMQARRLRALKNKKD